MAVIESGSQIEGGAPFLQSSTVTLTAAQMRALNTAPQTLIPTPGPNRFIMLDRVIVSMAAGTAFTSVGGTDDLEYRYTDENGAEIFDTETTGFLDQGTAEVRFTFSDTGAREPALNAPVVIACGGALTAGRDVTFTGLYYVVEV